uniref:Mitochondrial import inner membrane translocase subunit TIM50-C n=1 Tax=Cacopsylla melanoneura TaxID=428564 RepID=A0A8D9AG66_9HEMI
MLQSLSMGNMLRIWPVSIGTCPSGFGEGRQSKCIPIDLCSVQVIVIDWNPNAIHLHPENSLILPKWAGNDDDNTLVELVAFLKSVAEQSPSDVRDILRHYKQFSDPMEQFRESQRKLPLLPLPASPTHV